MPDSAVVAANDVNDAVGSEDRPGRRRLTLLVAPIIGLIVISNVGDASAPHLVDHHPLLLLAMNARNRNLLLVTEQLDAASYYIVGTLRLLLSDPLFFLLGYWYGDTVLDWMERRTKTFGQTLRQIEGWFSKAAYPLVFLAPNNYICMFAGASGMSVPGFFAINTLGTLARLYLIRRLGERFDGSINNVLDFIRDHRTPLLIISITLFAVVMINELRRAKTDFEALAEAVEHEDEPTDTPEEADP
jgi:membrane protein DedA with SNARE-associated domain